jgi:hypothetical protein
MMSLTTDQLDALWDIVNTARTNSKSVKVDKDALTALLIDYRKMYDEVTTTPEMRQARWTRHA